MAGLFSTPKPKVEPAKRMPDEQDPTADERRRRARQAALARQGRGSTILSQDNGSGSGGAYSREKLG